MKVYRQDYQTRLRQGLTMPTRLFPEAYAESRTGDYAISQVKLNNLQTYDIYYNPYGEVARVEAPTGGAYEYEYGAGVQSSLASGQMNDGYTPANMQSSPNPARTIYVYRRVTQRRAYFSRQTAHGTACAIGQPGNTCESFTDYKLSESKTGAASGIYEISFDNGYFEVETTGVNGARSRSRHHHLGVTSDGSARLSPAQDLRNSSFLANTLRGWVNEYTGKEWKTEDLNTTGTVLRTTTSTYAYNSYTKNANVTSSQTTLQDPGATVRAAKTDFEYDDQDNRSKVTEYSFANVKQRVIVTAYMKGEYVGSGYNLLSLPASETVYAGDEATKAAETQFTYDASTLAAVSACSGIVQHSANFGVGSALKRGNATEVKRWISGSSASVKYAASAFAYDEAGNIVQSRDPDLNLTSYEYASGYRCGLLTKITKSVNGVTHQSEAAYDLATGKPTEVKDAGGSVTKAGYESGLDRLAWMTRGEAGTAFPAALQDTANKTKTSFEYDDVNQTLTTRGDIHSFDEWNSSPATAALRIEKFDGFGRQTGAQV